jgi:hypothetical protein
MMSSRGKDVSTGISPSMAAVVMASTSANTCGPRTRASSSMPSMALSVRIAVEDDEFGTRPRQHTEHVDIGVWKGFLPADDADERINPGNRHTE